jgi:hypothetical protein
MSVVQGTARFVKKDLDERLRPFTKKGLNVAHTVEKAIRANAIDVGYDGMGKQGFAATSLRAYLDDCSCDNDEELRGALINFWKSPEGLGILRARFGSTHFQVFPTHATRRQAPPDHMPLVHIDYPKDYNLEDIYREWACRWEGILPSDLTVNYKLKGVLTVWVALSDVSNFPLWVADASTVIADETVVYKVGRRSSVGVYYNETTQWYTAPKMNPFDAWIFDTQHNPHVSVDLHSTSERRSVEVRCLVVEAM